MCNEVNPIDTNTKFIILMHPKEFKKTKNGTGHFTHLSLNNSELFIGVDFTNHKRINEIIDTYDSYVLYPSKKSINLSTQNPNFKNKIAIFIIDSTWSCSTKLLKDSKNLQALDYISFDTTKLSQFKIKEQPEIHCLSTIESTLSVIELLNKYKIENVKTNSIENFLNPFVKMVEYQLSCINNTNKQVLRYKTNSYI
ncbi:MAG: hypothetical protein COB17_07760 [Sulfurimonas sp.]|nr:MAG: hypothetical protein COB17_07760 [Sulfurimonas sp.]